MIQPHPKAFQSPMDAHRSFMAASKSKQTLRSIKSLSNAKSIPSDLISQEAKKAIVSMKIASKKVSRGFGSQKSLNSDAASSPSNSGKFFFLTNLSQERYPSPPTIREEEEEWEVDDDDDDGHGDSPSRSTRMISTKHDNVQGHRAPLESTKAVIVERPLLHSTFSRFKPNMALSTVDGENHATLLRSMDRQKQAMKENDKHLFGNDNEDFGEQDEQLLDQVVRGSLHHIPKLNFLESGRNILKSVDSIIAKWTMLPKPEKPRTPPPVEPEPMTAVSLFGEHLLRAEKVKDIPEDELQRLLNTPIEKRIYSNHRDYKPPPAKSPARREEMVSGSTRASAKSDRDDMAYFGAISSAIESSPSRPAPSALPPLDLTPITAASAANSVPPKIASPHFPPLHQPSTHNAAPSAQKILSTEPKTPTLPHQRGARDGAELFSPQFTTDQSNMMSYLSFLSPQSKSFLENFLENSDKPSGDQNPFLSPPPLYPQPLSHSNQGYSYQHSTTSYQPTDYINRSALGFDYHAPSAEKGRELNRKKSRDDVVFSERHLGNIQRHSVLAGQAEPVIYLPEDLDTANAAQQLVEEVVEEENGDVTIYKVPSHGASLLKLTDVLRPGAVLANQSFRQAENRLQQPHRTTSSLHYDYAQSLGLDSQVAMENIFDAEGDDDSYQGEKGHELDERNELFEGVEGGHSSVWEDYVSFLDTHNPELGLSATMAGSVASAGGAATVTTQSSPPPKPVYQPLPAISASPRSLDTPDSFVQQRALASQNAEHQASGLDLRDEILAFLQHSKSSLKEEYANYFTATAPAIPNDTVNKYAGSTIGFDDASTLASTDDEPKPSKFQFDEMKDASPEQSRLKLKAKLEDRYTRDLEGEYQMQRKVQAYLREGVRTQTQIRSKYEMDDGMLDEW